MIIPDDKPPPSSPPSSSPPPPPPLPSFTSSSNTTSQLIPTTTTTNSIPISPPLPLNQNQVPIIPHPDPAQPPLLAESQSTLTTSTMNSDPPPPSYFSSRNPSLLLPSQTHHPQSQASSSFQNPDRVLLGGGGVEEENPGPTHRRAARLLDSLNPEARKKLDLRDGLEVGGGTEGYGWWGGPGGESGSGAWGEGERGTGVGVGAAGDGRRGASGSGSGNGNASASARAFLNLGAGGSGSGTNGNVNGNNNNGNGNGNGGDNNNNRKNSRRETIDNNQRTRMVVDVPDLVDGNNPSLPSLPDGPPPEFTTYRAIYEMDSYGNIVSHDPHLNDSPEALFQFLKLQATSSPGLVCNVRGTHLEERKSTTLETDAHGHRHSKTTTQTVTVTDFNFSIPVLSSSSPTPQLYGRNAPATSFPSTVAESKGTLYVVPREVPAFRGGTWMEVGFDGERVKGNRRRSKSRRSRGRRGRGGGVIALEQGENEGLLNGGPADPDDLEIGGSPMESGDEDGEGEGHGNKEGEGDITQRGRLGWFWESERRRRLEREELRRKKGYPGWLPEAELEYPNLPPTASRPAFYDGLHLSHSGHSDPYFSDLSKQFTADQESRVRTWCRTFCSSPSPFKHFRTDKWIYGFDFDQAERRMRELIKIDSRYDGNLQIFWTGSSKRIVIRPDSKANRIFSLPGWAKFLLSLIWIYPILLILRKFWLGAYYETVRIGFPTQQWKFIKGSEGITHKEEARALLRNSWEGEAMGTGSIVGSSSIGLRDRMPRLPTAETVELVRPSGEYGEGWWWREGFGESEWAENWRWGILNSVRRKKCDGGQIGLA